MTKKELLEAIEDMPEDADVEEILFRHILNNRIGCDFRAEQMRTVLNNRKRFALLKPDKTEVRIYDDCLDILNKEFFELTLPYNTGFYTMIREIRDKTVEKICPVDDRIKGTRLSRIEMQRAGAVADIIESLCYEMFNHGYRYFKEQGGTIKKTTAPPQPKYPQSYEECLEIMGVKISDCYIQGYKAPLFEDLQQLLICRDAYWKIAGEEMGLGKPWEPDWNDNKQDKHGFYHEIKHTIISSTLFVFPTAKMRDAFYENFKKQIEECKEFL